MELRNWQQRRARARALLALLAVVTLSASSAVFWKMRETTTMSPAAARAVVHDPRSTGKQRRNAIAVVTIDLREAIADLRVHARDGDEFAEAALRQLRASADEALR